MFKDFNGTLVGQPPFSRNGVSHLFLISLDYSLTIAGLLPISPLSAYLLLSLPK